MKSSLLFLCSLFIIFTTCTLHAQTIFLVDAANKEITIPNPLSNVTQQDWQNACGDLQATIDAAPQGSKIWVRKGTYTLESGLYLIRTNRDKVFKFVKE